MILVDSRVGSRELLSTLRGFGVDADLGGSLDADFQFTGNGHDGPCLIGVERKTIQDLLNSMRDRRLAGQQLGRMISTFDVCYLIVEGVWRRGEDGMIEMLHHGYWKSARGNHHYAESDRFLCSLEMLCDVKIWRTADERETCAAIADRYSWWQKQWEDHTSTRVIYAPGPERKTKGHKPLMFRHEATLLEKWLAQLPGIDDRAIELAKYFRSPRDLANADVSRWMAIKGMRIGQTTAEKIVRAVGV